MRCYKKPFSWHLVNEEWLPVFGIQRNSTVQPKWLYFVHVCGFRFVFTSLAQIAEYRAFYARPLKPSFRYVDDRTGEHTIWKSDEARARLHRLPLRLWEKRKREKVVDALDRAIHVFVKG